ncbi:MAG: MFS transporter [Caulobacteraceae bacterium]
MRPVILIGTVVVGAATLLCAHISHLWQFYAIFAVFGGVGCSRIGYQKVIGALFTQHRGKALAIFGVESTVASAVVPLLTNFLLGHFGWRGMFTVFGLIILGMIPVLYWMLEEPGTVGQLPGLLGQRRGSAGPRAKPAPLDGMTIGQIGRDRIFWMILAASILSMAPAAGMMTHLIAAVQDKGFSRNIAVWTVSLTTLISPFGTLVGGYFTDKVRSPNGPGAVPGAAGGGRAVPGPVHHRVRRPAAAGGPPRG